MVAWALLADVVPLYPLYALLFDDTGLSGDEISLLFAIWSAVGIVAEVPSGAVADRFSRRSCLVAGGVVQALGYALWMLLPGFPGFAAGFVLWGLGGSLVSGAQEALLYDGLAAAGAQDRYAAIAGRVTAAGLVAQVPAALAATVLFGAGGYALVGWVSVGTCLAAAAVAATLPEAPRTGHDPDGDEEEDGAGYLATLRAGLVEATTHPGVLPVLVAVAALASLDGIEEYFPLIVSGWGVPTAVVPIADLPIVLGGVVGAALGGVVARWGNGRSALLLGVAMALFALSDLVRHPAAVVGIALFYGGYRAVLVAVQARLQERIDSRSRATVTSVAGLGTDVATFALYAAWAIGEVPAVAVLGAVVAALLPLLLRPPRHGPRRP